MRDALSDLLFLFRREDENSLDHFERVAERFHTETGMLRPGKSQPDEYCGTPTDEERQVAYSNWHRGFIDRAREALATSDRKNKFSV
jgi:hypothetical protein